MLYGKCTEGCITITTLPDSRNEHISVTELDKAAERIKVLGTSANTYYCVALRQEGLPSSVRGGIGQIHTVVCMVADVDVLGSVHKENALPKTEEAIDFVNSLKLKPSIIVRSGNGVHAIWLLDEPFVIRNENEREQIRELSAGFGMYVIAEGRKKGWKLDNVQDIPRMLRAPGSLNFKSDPPKQCAVRASARSVFSFRIVLSLKSWISIALTTETKKPASFNVSAIGLQYVLVCSITIRISPPSFLSVDASFFKSLFVWWTSKGRSAISPPGLRTATVLLLLDTSIPTAVITAASIFLTSFNAGSAYAHYRFSLLCDTNVRQHFYLPITQPASIERCNGDGGKQFARTSVQLKQCFVLSAHLHCSLGLGICIAHWL